MLFTCYLSVIHLYFACYIMLFDHIFHDMPLIHLLLIYHFLGDFFFTYLYDECNGREHGKGPVKARGRVVLATRKPRVLPAFK